MTRGQDGRLRVIHAEAFGGVPAPWCDIWGFFTSFTVFVKEGASKWTQAAMCSIYHAVALDVDVVTRAFSERELVRVRVRDGVLPESMHQCMKTSAPRKLTDAAQRLMQERVASKMLEPSQKWRHTARLELMRSLCASLWDLGVQYGVLLPGDAQKGVLRSSNSGEFPAICAEVVQTLEVFMAKLVNKHTDKASSMNTHKKADARRRRRLAGVRCFVNSAHLVVTLERLGAQKS